MKEKKKRKNCGAFDNYYKYIKRDRSAFVNGNQVYNECYKGLIVYNLYVNKNNNVR